MKMIRNGVWMNIGARQILTVIVSVNLYLGISPQDSGAATGFCDDEFTCCSGDTDCTEGGTCVLKRGQCSFGAVFTPCDVDSECESPLDFPQWCAPIGRCVGGDSHGEPCVMAQGVCAWLFSYCRDSLDCPEYIFCEPTHDCPDGTCVPCVGGCSIATVTMGTELQGRIAVLQSFRDKYLINSALGKAFVTAYYKYSPPIADYLAERDWLRRSVRIMLLPIIGLASWFV